MAAKIYSVLVLENEEINRIRELGLEKMTD
jgi:hypothetical protein